MDPQQFMAVGTWWVLTNVECEVGVKHFGTWGLIDALVGIKRAENNNFERRFYVPHRWLGIDRMSDFLWIMSVIRFIRGGTDIFALNHSVYYSLQILLRQRMSSRTVIYHFGRVPYLRWTSLDRLTGGELVLRNYIQEFQKTDGREWDLQQLWTDITGVAIPDGEPFFRKGIVHETDKCPDCRTSTDFWL